MSNPYESSTIPFDEAAARPRTGGGPLRVELSAIELLKEGKALISDQYWTFFGVAALGMLIGSAAPLGIVMGPMMCGIYMCFLAKIRGEPVDVNMLFKGFDHFKNSFLATLLMMAAMFAVMIPIGGVFGVVAFSMGEKGILLALFGFYGLIFFVSIAVGIFFIFTYPLIADRGYAAMDACKLSFAAAKMNLGGLLRLMLLNFAISIVAMLFCYFPAFLFMPINFASLTIAYSRIFPDD